jgi:hypothetical protein
MAGRKLKVGGSIHDEKTGVTHVFKAGDEVPADVAKLIKNPDVWEDDEDEDEAETPGDSQFAVPDEEELEKKVAHPGEDAPTPARKSGGAAKAAAPTPASEA